MDQIRGIPRPVEVPSEGLMCDLLWSDPDSNPIAPNLWANSNVQIINSQFRASDCSLTENGELAEPNPQGDILGMTDDLNLTNEDYNEVQGSRCSWGINERGVSYTFGPEVVTQFLIDNNLDLICRAHQVSKKSLFLSIQSRSNLRPQLTDLLQVVEDGYQFFAQRGLVTIFSASNYCGEFDNAGAMMTIKEDLLCSFKVSEIILIP